MARITVKGVDEYAEKLKRLSKNSDIIMKKSVYNGADIVADAMKKGLESIPVEEGEIPGLPPYGTAEKKVYGLSRRQKADLIQGFGISKFENTNGYINVKIGFDGYGSVKTKRHPNGMPNVMLARAITSGSSFRKKNPILRKKVTESKEKAIEKMSDTIDEELRKEFE